MPNMIGAGPACCCCRHLIRLRDNIQGTVGNGTYWEVTKPDENLQLVHPLNSPVGRTSLCGNLDWVHKKAYYAETNGTDSFIRWWSPDKFAGSDGHDAPATDDVADITNYQIYSLATSADEEVIYYAGRDEFPDGSANYGIEFSSINYDGTGQTLLDTVNVYRTGGPGGNSGMVGPMLVNRTTNYLYYVLRENYSTASANVWEISLRRRDLATFTESTLHTHLFPGLGSQRTSTYIRQINSLSFDIDGEKVYWVEHYYTTGVRHESIVKRSDYDGSNVETLYTSADPYAVNFARFSNSLQKIIHADYNRTSTNPAPLDGMWIREKDWTEVRKVSLISQPDADMAFPPASHAKHLWCGWEKTGSGSKA